MQAFQQFLLDHGLSHSTVQILVVTAKGIIVLASAGLVDLIARRVLLRVAIRIIERSATTFDDDFLKHRVLDRLSHLLPVFIVLLGTTWIFSGYPGALAIAKSVVLVITTVLVVAIINGVLNACLDIYKSFPVSRRLPINALVQILKLIVLVFAAITLISHFLDRSPFVLLSGLGALSAVTMLVFRDPIMGLASGIQLTANNMVEVGDWIEVPSDGIDGEVREVNLTTVAVQNWDKTISTVPAYKLMNGHFRNWKGMDRSGGRRIKRNLVVDMTTIRFCDTVMLERFKKVQYITDYVNTKIKEVEAYNKAQSVDESVLINGRRLTNVGTFRAYIKAYLLHHPKLNKELTFLIRHLEPTPHGLPIQIYVFSSDQAWVAYEEIQADIFDHLLAAAPLFDLRIFQEPAGGDIRAVAEALEHRPI